LPVRFAVEREHTVLGEHRQDASVGGPGVVGARRGVQHLVGEVGRTDNEHPAGYRACQWEQGAARAAALCEGLKRVALKRDRVP
jgi:hypothetical protein